MIRGSEGLIDRMYASATDKSLLPKYLEEYSQVIGASSGTVIVLSDVRTGAGHILCSARTEQRYSELYEQYYSRQNISVEALRRRGTTALTGLESYQSAGMSAIEVIRTATTKAAELLGLEKEIGSLEAGKLADLIGVTEDPLADIGELRRVRFVMKGGAVIRRP